MKKKQPKQAAQGVDIKINPQQFMQFCRKQEDGVLNELLQVIALPIAQIPVPAHEQGEAHSFATSMIIVCLQHQENRILSFEKEEKKGVKGLISSSAKEKEIYVAMRKKVKAQLGDRFQEVYDAARAEENNVRPAFDDNGNLLPLGNNENV
jgi:hypothetical protein